MIDSRVLYEVYLFSTYKEGVEYLSQHIGERIKFLTNAFSSSSSTEPDFRLTNVLYHIASRLTLERITVMDEANGNDNISIGLTSSLESLDNQQWLIQYLGENKYQIIDRDSLYALAHNSEETNLTLLPLDNNNEEQQGKITSVLNGIYGIVNVASGYAIGMGNKGNSLSACNDEIIDDFGQQWVILKVTASEEPTGNALIHQEEKMRIYPNPVFDMFMIELPQTMKSSREILVDVMDMNGKFLYRLIDENINREIIHIDMASLNINSGIYLLKVRDSQKQFIEKLIIK